MTVCKGSVGLRNVPHVSKALAKINTHLIPPLRGTLPFFAHSIEVTQGNGEERSKVYQPPYFLLPRHKFQNDVRSEFRKV